MYKKKEGTRGGAYVHLPVATLASARRLLLFRHGPDPKIYFEPGAPTTIFNAPTISGSISAGNPITISLSAIPENFLDPSQPSEKFGSPGQVGLGRCIGTD
jgi:hypothetical protein